MSLPFGLKAELPKCAQRLLASGFGFLGVAGSAGVTAALASPEHPVAAGVAGAVAVTAGLLVNEFHRAYHESRDEERAGRNHLVRRGMARALSQALRAEEPECEGLFPPDIRSAVFVYLPRYLQKAADGSDNALLDGLFPLALSEEAWDVLNRYQAELEPSSLNRLSKGERDSLLQREEQDQAALATLLRNLPVPESGEEEIRSYLAQLSHRNCEAQIKELAARLLPQFRIEFAVVFSAGGPESLAIEYKHEKFTRAALIRIAELLNSVKRDTALLPGMDAKLDKLLQAQTPAPRTGKPQNLPFATLGNLFKGREADMEALERQLKKSGAAAIVQPASITGMGGIGKTRLAIEYALRHEGEFSALLFVTANTVDELNTNFALLSGPLALNLPEYRSGNQPEQYAAVLKWLQANKGWLLILDNVDTVDKVDIKKDAIKAVQQLVPRLSCGQALITSRVSEWGSEIRAIGLDLLSEEAAVSYLIEKTAAGRQPSQGDESEAQALAEELGRLALALEQAAAWINARGISLAEYRRRWQQSNQKLLAFHDDQAMQYPRTVAVTFLTSFEQLSPNGRRLLNLLAWLAPEPVPQFLVEVRGGPFAAENEENLPEEQWPGAQEEAEEALSDLVRFSLATRSMDRNAFSVHRLVQTVARRNQTNDDHDRCVATALRWVDKGIPFDTHDVRFWPIVEQLTPHALAIAAEADRREIAGPTARLMNQLGAFFWSRAEWSQAERMMRRVVSIFEKSLGPDHPNVATALNNLAELLKATNRLAEAEPLYRRVVGIFEANDPEHQPNYAGALNNLAGLLYATNRLAEAEPMYRRALAIDERSYGPDHPEVATDLNNLAALLEDTNRLAEAEPMYRRALAIDEKSYGPEHPEVATALNNLAVLLRATNRLAEAEPMYRRALAIGEQSFGPEHPTVAIRLNNLAGLLRATNRLAEAEPMFRRALAIDEKSHGPDHPEVATDLNNLAGLLYATNRLAEAEPMYRRALAIDEKSYGPDHPEVATDLNNLAGLLQATNRLAEAEPMYRRVVSIFEKSLGPDHPNVATALNNLAGLLEATNRLNEAEPMVRRTLEIRINFTRATGHPHPHLQDTVNNYAGLLEKMGMTQEQILARLREMAPEFFE
jgi:tetratricopeptide (TPR) repeat protein